VDISKITDDIFVGTTPGTEDYDLLRERGVTLVINMRFENRPQPDNHNPPMARLWLRTFDSPLIPIPMRALHKGVGAALEAIQAGGKVFIHCAAGVHRSVALAAALLIAQGHKPDEATELLKERRPAADPDIWYIRRRIDKFARSWEA
jgi:dual specificity MAP kinase phosphatase